MKRIAPNNEYNPYGFVADALKTLLDAHNKGENAPIANILWIYKAIHSGDDLLTAKVRNDDFSFFYKFALDYARMLAGEEHDEITSERWEEYRERWQRLDDYRDGLIKY